MSIPPQSEESKVLRFLDSIDSEAESVKRQVIKNWEENIRQVRGDQWRIRRAPYFMANVIGNETKKAVGTLTETKPQIQVSAIQPELSKAASVLYNAVKATWDRHSTDDAIYRLCKFGNTLGCGFLRTPYDPMRDDFFVEFVDPRRVFLDPGIAYASDLDQAQYIRIDNVLSVHEVKRRFPGRGSLVKPDARYSSYPEGDRSPTRLATVLSMQPSVYRRFRGARPGPIPRCEVKEYWIKDPNINDSGNLLFPGGRHIFRAADVILSDEPNPYWDGLPDIDMFEWDVDYDSPWGIDGVSDLRRIQEAINRMGDAWVRNYLLGSNFKIIADLDALDPDQWDKIDNEAGLVIRKKPQREFRYEPPVTPSDNLPGIIQGFIQLMDMLSGNFDMGGRSPVQGSSALEGLQAARQTLIRATSRRLESLLERVGQKLISRVFQFYTSDRILLQQGPNKDWISYIYERQKLLQKDNGDMRSVEERQKMYRDFRFLVTPGSSLAMTRIQRTMAALQLRAATGVAPSVRRILQEADLGDPDELIQEGIEEAKLLPPPPPPKGRGGRQ